MKGTNVAATAAMLLLVAVSALSCAQLAAAGLLDDMIARPGHLLTQPEPPANLRRAATMRKQPVHVQCGTSHPPKTEITSIETARVSAEASRVNQRGAAAGLLARKNIRVVFHTIVRTNYLTLTGVPFYEGYLSRTQLRAQVAELNKAFSGRRGGRVDTNIRFYWNYKTDWYYYDTFNYTSGWFNIVKDSEESLAYKQTYRKGNSLTLNVYTANLASTTPGRTLLGYATFPWDYKKKTLNDGVFMHYDAMTGGNFLAWSQGVTLVHEVGHWVGLYHTFQGGCHLTKGDYVVDTVPEATDASGCPKNRKTCTGKGYKESWRDPVNNFMDYTTDKCRTTFTRGQASRADAAWKVWRGCGACRSIKGSRT